MDRTPLEVRLQEAQLEMAIEVIETARELKRFLQKIAPLVEHGLENLKEEQRILRGRK